MVPEQGAANRQPETTMISETEGQERHIVRDTWPELKESPPCPAKSSCEEPFLCSPICNAVASSATSTGPDLPFFVGEDNLTASTESETPLLFVCLKSIELHNPEHEPGESINFGLTGYHDFNPATVQSGLTDAEGKKAANALAKTIKQNQCRQEKAKDRAAFEEELAALGTPVKEAVHFHKRDRHGWRTQTTYRYALSIPVGDLPPIGKTPWDVEADPR